MQKTRILINLLSVFSFLVFPYFSARICASPHPEKIQDLRENIIALNRICTNALDTLSKASAKETMSKKEQYEYRMYIAYLKGRIESYCTELSRIAGEKATKDLPCTQKTYLSFTSREESENKTTAEQISDLDHALLSSLGNFDEILLKESERLKEITPRHNAYVDQSAENAHSENMVKTDTAGAKGAKGIKSDKDRSARNTSGKTGSTERNKNTPETDGTGPKGHSRSDTNKSVSSKNTGYSANRQESGIKAGDHRKDARASAATDTDSLSADDDIVARQLREAAEKETDPELKKRLWEEYRKYKEGK